MTLIQWSWQSSMLILGLPNSILIFSRTKLGSNMRIGMTDYGSLLKYSLEIIWMSHFWQGCMIFCILLHMLLILIRVLIWLTPCQTTQSVTSLLRELGIGILVLMLLARISILLRKFIGKLMGLFRWGLFMFALIKWT